VIGGGAMIGCDDGDDDTVGATTQPTAGERAGRSVENAMDKAGDVLQRESTDVGQAVQSGVDKTNEALKEGTAEAKAAFREGADKAEDVIDRGAQRTGEAMEETGERMQRDGAAATRPTTVPVR
jgi:hypothetical protein